MSQCADVTLCDIMPIVDGEFVSDSVSEKTNVLLQNGHNDGQNLNGHINFLQGRRDSEPGSRGRNNAITDGQAANTATAATATHVSLIDSDYKLNHDAPQLGWTTVDRTG